jgi:hypothetical protein
MVHTEHPIPSRSVGSKVAWVVLWLAAIAAVILSFFAEDYGFWWIAILLRILAAIPVVAACMLLATSILRARTAPTSSAMPSNTSLERTRER